LLPDIAALKSSCNLLSTF